MVGALSAGRVVLHTVHMSRTVRKPSVCGTDDTADPRASAACLLVRLIRQQSGREDRFVILLGGDNGLLAELGGGTPVDVAERVVRPSQGSGIERLAVQGEVELHLSALPAVFGVIGNRPGDDALVGRIASPSRSVVELLC